MTQHNPAQFQEIKVRYAELIVDNMDEDSLVKFAEDVIKRNLDRRTESELMEEIEANFDSIILESLLDDVKNVRHLKLIRPNKPPQSVS